MQKNIPTSNKYLTQVHPCRRNFLFFILIWIHLGHGLDTKEKKIEKKGRFFTIQNNLSFLLWNVRDFSSLFDMQLIDTELGSLALLCEVWQCSFFAVLSSNSWTLSVLSLSTCIYPKALFIG